MKVSPFLYKSSIIIIMITGYSNITNSNVIYAKDTNSKIYKNRSINQLHQISDVHSQCLIQIQQQLAENQQDIDTLRGYIQDMQHHILEIINNQNESCQKINNILKQYSNVHDSSDDSTKLAINSNTEQHKVINNTTIIDADTAYKKAVLLVLEKKQYNQAIEAFQNFIKNYPKSIYQANSHYWLGQLYYNKGNKDDASYYFALVVKNYPKSIKAPDALLKIGIIMQETEQTDKAKTIYRQVGKLYPNSDAAKQAQKRLIHL